MSSPGEGGLGPAVAGSWYPAAAETLRLELDRLLDAASSTPAAPGTGRVVALVAPHAGYAYSGQVAAHGFAELRGRKVARVLLIGPSHYAAFAGAAVPEAAFYRTPLGDVRLDGEAVAALAAAARVGDAPFRTEHSLEAEIPFLQRALATGWRLVPLLIGGRSSASDLATVARALEPWFGPDTLVVISSDFTHFGPRFGYVPFERDVPERIERLDLGAVECILARDVTGFEQYVERTGATICGRDAIGVLLRLLPDGLAGAVAAYDTSGRMTGDWNHSVSYASLVFRERPGTTVAPCTS